MTVKYGHPGNQYQIFNSTVGPNFQMNGGTFELDSGASVVIPDTASSLAGCGTLIGNAGLGIDGRETLQIAAGQAGNGVGGDGPWGSSLTVQSRNGNPVTFQVNSNVSANLINEFQGTLLVATSDTGYFIGSSQGPAAQTRAACSSTTSS